MVCIEGFMVFGFILDFVNNLWYVLILDFDSDIFKGKEEREGDMGRNCWVIFKLK